jgi:hypothetical protein
MKLAISQHMPVLYVLRQWNLKVWHQDHLNHKANVTTSTATTRAVEAHRKWERWRENGRHRWTFFLFLRIFWLTTNIFYLI